MNIPICYLVGIGYLSMLAAQVASPGKLKNRLFYPAWALVFLIAASGTGLEVSIPRQSRGLYCEPLKAAVDVAAAAAT